MLFPHARKAATAIFGPDTDWSDKGRVRGRTRDRAWRFLGGPRRV
jgi:hypothetical protein